MIIMTMESRHDINVRIEEKEAFDEESSNESVVDEADNFVIDNHNVQKIQQVLHEAIDEERGNESVVDEADNVPTDNHNVQKNQHIFCWRSNPPPKVHLLFTGHFSLPPSCTVC